MEMTFFLSKLTLFSRACFFLSNMSACPGRLELEPLLEGRCTEGRCKEGSCKEGYWQEVKKVIVKKVVVAGMVHGSAGGMVLVVLEPHIALKDTKQTKL